MRGFMQFCSVTASYAVSISVQPHVCIFMSASAEREFPSLPVDVLPVLLFSDAAVFFLHALHKIRLILFLTGLKYIRISTGVGTRESKINMTST